VDYGKIDHFQTGVAAAVFSLRGDESCGNGEFLDLLELGAWSKDCGLDLIQILPVNDSGPDPSPYGALSAFALHPIYVRLSEVPGAEAMADRIDDARRRFEGEARLQYHEVLAFKRDVLREIFSHLDPATTRANLSGWIEDNDWVKTYAVYQVLRTEHGDRPWWEWDQLSEASPEEIEQRWGAGGEDALFHVWVQHELERQLKIAATGLAEFGVRLKGDLPILLNEDSVDVWAHPQFFDRTWRAGAPPDMFSAEGQNWGFPCYRWETLQKMDYSWWRRRLRHASRFYHAIRIDHVLGFFRIWRIPADAVTGMLGQYDPSVPIRTEDLVERGFSSQEIDAWAVPGGDTSAAAPSEVELFELENEDDRQAGLRWLRDRLLLRVPEQLDAYRPSWHYRESRQYAELTDEKRWCFDGLIEEDDRRQQELWAKTGRERLGMVLGASDMLVCAEDLGAVPACVPAVLQELGIYGLRVERWTRRWGEPGPPFVAPADYDRLTVCSPSGHDTSTLRGWWHENEEDRRTYAPLLGVDGDPPDHLDGELYRRALERNLDANSLFCILPLQEYLGLAPEWVSDDPRQDRVNVPGTTAETNWSYRMPRRVSELRLLRELSEEITRRVERRRARPLD
jgi:4-alpha-glucanotransferase